MDNKVLDEAVEVALTAYVNSRGSYEGEVPASSDDIRAALLASLPVLLGPVVAEWRTSAEVIRGFHRASWFDRGQAQGIERCADDLAAIYAPSLGEGDGR